MHIPDGFLSAPVNAAAFAVSAAVLAVAVRKAKDDLDERTTPLLGVTAAFVFAAQMINFPVAGGTSGHFLGAVLAGILLGPLNACLVLGLVLIIQCLVFADGGLTALGSNIFNMGIVGGIGGTLLFRALRAILPDTRAGFTASAVVASWASVVMAAASCALMLSVSGTSPLRIVLPAMTAVHALIGAGEALITVTVLRTLMAVRPDLIGAYQAGGAR